MTNRRRPDRLLLHTLPLVLALAACGSEPIADEPVREPIGIRYVAADELPVRESPAESSPVVATIGVGQPVTILAEREGWAEVRITFDRSGWARASALSDQPVSSELAAGGGSSTPRFRVAPSPVFSPTGARGEIVLEARVNTDGDVVDVRTIRNTTGRADLEAKNADELRRARFYPLVVNGERRPFIYEHRVEY